MPEVKGNPNRYLVTATMDDVPHLDKAAQEAILASMPAYQREARRTGTPALGAGAIYPIEDSFVTVDDFEIPAYFPRCFGMDTGFKATAGVWIALNRETNEKFIYSCYKRGGVAGGNGLDSDEQFDHTEPVLHAEAFKARGAWIPGVADAAAIRSTDGKQYLMVYRDLGLQIKLPDKRSVEANILAVWNDLSMGKLKIFKSCLIWFDEKRVYRRDEDGKVVRQNDHLMAATQYAMKELLNDPTFPKIRPVERIPYYRPAESSGSAWT